MFHMVAGKKQNISKIKRVVMVATGVPEDVGGAPIRNYQLLKALTKLPNCEVTLFCLCSERRFRAKKIQLEEDLPIKTHFSAYRNMTLITKIFAVLIARMQPYMASYRYRSSLGRDVWNFCRVNNVDVIQIEQLDAYYCLEPYIKRLRSIGIKIVLDEHNIESDVINGTSKSLAFPLNIVGSTLIRPLRKLERSAIQNSDAVLACSQVDANFFLNTTNQANVYVVPNGVDCEQYRPSRRIKKKDLIFIGSPLYPPNADALKYYLRDIHPLISKVQKDVVLHIIGRGTEEWLESQSVVDKKTIIPYGFVKDIRHEINQSAIGICPIRAGSGTRLKLLTYMASELAVVSTSKGAEGIDYTNGKDILIADSPELFAKEIIDLINNPKRQRSIGSKARNLAVMSYDWTVVTKNIQSVYANILTDS